MKNKEAKPIFLDKKACYAALSAHDARFDGRFFVGVSSTGIYCRPVCRVRLPKEENCTFFISAAAAEAEGYRPCLKCRPELAPGISSVDASAWIARKAIYMMEEDSLVDSKISDLAELLGVTDRHLRRVFSLQYGVSPIQYLQTRKLLLAKSLLTDTKLSVTEIAMAAGFGSIRRFNALFKKHYGFPPSKLRGMEEAVPVGSAGITLLLGYRPPYAWDEMLSFLAARAIPGVESVKDSTYRRTVSVKREDTIYRGWISIANVPKKNALSVTLAPSLLPVLSTVMARIRHYFDINCDPLEINEKLSKMNELSTNMYIPGLRLPGCFDTFEMAVLAILEQENGVKASRTSAFRLASAFGEKMDTPFDELHFTFPSPDTIFHLEPAIGRSIKFAGITSTQANAIYALAEAMTKGSIVFSYGTDPEKEKEKLLRLPGIHSWTAHYIGMRALNWPDSFLLGDDEVKRVPGGRTYEEFLHLSHTWKPWRSYATIALWSFLQKNTSAERNQQ